MTTTPRQPAQAHPSSQADPAAALPPLPETPAWLDEVEGEQALEWVRERNEATRATYEDAPGFEQLRADIEEILDSADKIPGVALAAGKLYNFWTDAAACGAGPPGSPTVPAPRRRAAPPSGRSCWTWTPWGRPRA